MHADRGSQYHAKAYRNALTRLEIRPSASRTGLCLDGVAGESFFATIKAEIGTDSWLDRATARRDIVNWIKIYNERRLHSSLGYETRTEARMSWQQRISIAARVPAGVTRRADSRGAGRQDLAPRSGGVLGRARPRTPGVVPV